MNTLNALQKSVTAKDQIVATLDNGRKVLARVYKSGFHDLDDVVNQITTQAGSFIGMGNLCIRNNTQGWAFSMPLASATKRSSALHRHAPAQLPHEGRQYLIPW